MFWRTFQRLCKEADKSPSRVMREIGLSPSAHLSWKKGAIPREETLRRIADYFHFPIQDLTTEEDNPLFAPDFFGPDFMTRTERRIFEAARLLTPEQQEELAAGLEAMIAEASSDKASSDETNP